MGGGGLEPPTSVGSRRRCSFSELPAHAAPALLGPPSWTVQMAGAKEFGGEATARPVDLRAEARRALDTTSPYFYANWHSGVQSGSFRKNRPFSFGSGSVAIAVAWSSKSSSSKTAILIPAIVALKARSLSASSSGTVQTTIEEIAFRFPKRMPAS